MRVTTYKDIVIRRWRRYNFELHVTYTEAHTDLMRFIGKCLKAGGRVEFSTAVATAPNRPLKHNDVYERANCKLYWDEAGDAIL